MAKEEPERKGGEERVLSRVSSLCKSKTWRVMKLCFLPVAGAEERGHVEGVG